MVAGLNDPPSMISRAPIFDWNNFTQFMQSLFGGDADMMEIHTSPRGMVYDYPSQSELFSGRFSLFDFSPSLRAIIVEGTCEEEVIFSIRDGDWVRFNFALSINISMDDLDRAPVQLTTPSWRIIDHPGDKIIREVLPAQAEARWLTIICKPDLIQTLAGRSIDDLPEFLRFVDGAQERSTRHRDFVLRSRFVAITTDILKTRIEDPLHIAYVRARCEELLCLALEDLIDPIDTDGLPVLSDADNERITAAQRFIDDRFRENLTVTDIATVSGLNRNSLFYGFKKKVGVSVSEYIQTRKLEEAKYLIEHTDDHLIDVADSVGFKHQTSFITAFRKRFGVTPGKLRRGKMGR